MGAAEEDNRVGKIEMALGLPACYMLGVLHDAVSYMRGAVHRHTERLTAELSRFWTETDEGRRAWHNEHNEADKPDEAAHRPRVGGVCHAGGPPPLPLK